MVGATQVGRPFSAFTITALRRLIRSARASTRLLRKTTTLPGNSGYCRVMIIRRETEADIPAIRSVTAAAFAAAAHSAPPVTPGGDPGEATLIEWLREDESWIPELSVVAVVDDTVVGHLVATRAHIGSSPAIGIGPVSVVPEMHGRGVGSALMHFALGAADAMGETVAGLLGDPAFYTRFGFAPAAAMDITGPDPSWGDYFQARALSSYSGQRGAFRYAEPFSKL